MTERLNSALCNVRKSSIREFTRIAKSVEGCMFLTLGEPDFNTPDEIKRQAKMDLDANLTHYPENNGQPQLRMAISDFEREKNRLDYAEDEIIVTIGATEALFVALFGILNPGDEVIVPVPAYVLYEQVINLMRGKYVPLETGDTAFQPVRERLEAAITPATKAIILTSPNNPTGCIYTEETLDMIADVLRGRDIFIICDDVYSQLVYTDRYKSFSSYRQFRDRMIVVQSFAKPYAMTGWRVGYLMTDRPLKQKLEVIHQYAVVSAASFVQNACVEALRSDPGGMVEIYRKRRDYVYGRIVGMGLPVNKPEGAFYIFPDISRYGMDSMTFATKLANEGKLAVTPGVSFGDDNCVRISYCYSDEELREGMDRLERFIGGLDRR
ncbi:MAG: aminotransferase class I/II-fold pyridoxal phosphate-dependent enzyme [Clostridia bacterium]|nr:aminotransferase class I/II-fold pyridoxal phosphate-dependent enzyme [Clostridia bacterium]